jgi:hypothetical protein
MMMTIQMLLMDMKVRLNSKQSGTRMFVKLTNLLIPIQHQCILSLKQHITILAAFVYYVYPSSKSWR